jgi:hypothetical protein
MEVTVNRSMLVFLLLAAPTALADGSAVSGGSYTIKRHTIDSGGGQSSGGEFSLHGTIGQLDAGPTLSGASFQLQGGFWPGFNRSVISDILFRDRFEAGARSRLEAATGMPL